MTIIILYLMDKNNSCGIVLLIQYYYSILLYTVLLIDMILIGMLRWWLNNIFTDIFIYMFNDYSVAYCLKY